MMLKGDWLRVLVSAMKYTPLVPCHCFSSIPTTSG